MLLHYIINKGNNKITELRTILQRESQTDKISQQPENCENRNMGQRKGTYNLSALDAVNDINILRRLAENGGSIAVSEYINESINRLKKEELKFAIIGFSATGKYTFLDTIRNLKPGDDGFAKARFGNTTITPTLRVLPKNDQITFYDLPGYSSIKCKKTEYISEMKIFDCDFFFIFFKNVLIEDEKWLVGALRKLGKPFSLVRPKIDFDI